MSIELGQVGGAGADPRPSSRGSAFGQRLMRCCRSTAWSILTVLLALFFSILLPQTFPTLLNLRSIVADKAIIAILSLAVMIPMVTGKIDLTVGYGIVLWHILAISLQVWYGVPWPVAALIVLLLGAAVGFLNGLLVEVAQIDSFIATLGIGTVLYAVAMWHSDGRQIVGTLPDGFFKVNTLRLLGVPITGFYVLALALRAVVRARVPADRPLPLRHRRQPARRRR